MREHVAPISPIHVYADFYRVGRRARRVSYRAREGKAAAAAKASGYIVNGKQSLRSAGNFTFIASEGRRRNEAHTLADG